jgi:NhaP-type Na+/H+ or K+/H+ antiporter
MALAIAVVLDGNYFIACFVAGISAGYFVRGTSQNYTRFAETLTQVLSLVVIMFVGAKLVDLRSGITWRIVLYAVLSLTLVRMLPVAVAMWRDGLQRQSLLFLGWFGPRGLASIVLALIVVNALADIPHRETIVTVVVVTVSLSVFLHGISAIPLIVWYGRTVERLDPGAPEKRAVDEIPVRAGWLHQVGHADQRVTTWEARRGAHHGKRKRR